MEGLIYDILCALREHGRISDHQLDRIIQIHNKKMRTPHKHFAKKMIWPSYTHIKQEHNEIWRSWQVDDELEEALRATVRMKPRRTASGVATITVITKPAACSSNCLFCPSDVRMPKSYLHDEPACQRAERNYFDPYLQVTRRLRALREMGHPTDKVELIVLGGTFTDYPASYQVWFIHELFRALNSDEFTQDSFEPGWLSDTELQRCERYKQAGIASEPSTLANQVRDTQDQVSAGTLSFNQAIDALYGDQSHWGPIHEGQQATLEQLFEQHVTNEHSAHRNVGLVIETRPDALDADALTLLRTLGCTKIQMGVQSLDEDLLTRCGRTMVASTTARAFELLRAFGFKSHAHFMVNLPEATPTSDKQAWHTFMTDTAYRPDEVKLYPCALIAGTGLERAWNQGAWTPYSEDDLVDILAFDVLNTPSSTRISRMIRDFSAGDIVAGNKKANLRQMVEAEVAKRAERDHTPIREMRMREVATDAVDTEALHLETEHYPTSNTEEYFLQWVDDNNRLAGFLRLSLPHTTYLTATSGLPIKAGHAMIREVHIYGTTARLQHKDGSAQHTGLGRALIEKAEHIARDAGYTRINVISAIGTRDYYRSLGFTDTKLYQQKVL